MVLIYDRMPNDPRIKRLSAGAAVTWLTAISACNTLGRETIEMSELEEWFAPRRARDETADLEERLAELAASELIERLPAGHIRFLARLDLWAFDEEEGPGF